MGGLSDKIAKGLVGLLVGIMVLSFAVWGMEDVFQPGNRNAVVTLGEEPIESTEFRDAFRRQVNQLNTERELGMTNEEAYRAGVHRDVLNDLVTAKVIDIDAQELGIGVNNKLAREVVEGMPAFRNSVTGKLDLDELDRRLQRAGVTRAAFEKDILDSLRREQTVPAIVGGIDVPGEFAKQRFRFLSEQRAADVMTLTAESVDVPADPDEATLQSWIADNSRLYTAPEFRRVQLMRIEPFDISPDLEVEEEDVAGYYDYLLSLPAGTEGAIASPETRNVVQIKASSEDEATSVAARLAAGEDPQVVADSIGAEAPTVIDKATPAQILDPNVSTAAFAMEADEGRAVYGSLPFWYGVAVTEIVPAVKPALADVRGKIEYELLENLAKDRLFDITSDIEDAMDQNMSFDEIADQVGLVISTLDYIDRTGTTEDGLRMAGFARIPGVASDDTILREMFTNDIGYETDLFETSTGGYAAVKVLDIKDAALRPLEDIRDRSISDWKTKQVDEALQALSIATVARLRKGDDFATVAAEAKATSEREIIVRTARNPNIGDSVLVGLLDGDVNDVVRGAGAKPLTRQVAKLTRIQGTTDALAGEFADALNEASRLEIAADIQNAYRQSVLSENPVEENNERILSVLGIDNPAQ